MTPLHLGFTGLYIGDYYRGDSGNTRSLDYGSCQYIWSFSFSLRIFLFLILVE